MHPLLIEVIGNSLALTCVLLIKKNSPWNWPVGILNCIFYLFLFIPNKLYGDSLLQIIYIILSLFGLYLWLTKKEGKPRPITKCSNMEIFYSCFLGIIVLNILLHFLGNYTDSTTVFVDSFITTTCLIATVLMSYRKIDHWAYWILSNICFFPLYCYKGLYITAVFQIPLLIFSFMGYNEWRKQLKS